MTSAHRRFKDDVYGQLARVGKAVAAPKRLELLELLTQAPRTVEAIADEAGLSVANASQHLGILRAARLVETEKKGLYVEYRIADEQVALFVRALRAVADSRLAEVEQVTRVYFEERGAMDPVKGEDLLGRVRRGEVIVIDVRPPEEYRAGHVPGALSLPLPELAKRLREGRPFAPASARLLSKRREIVVYCRGPSCVMAVEAVALLRKKGFRANRMEEGVVDWRARGWRVERSDEEEARS